MTDRIAQLERLVALDPTDSECLYSLAFEHAKAGDHANAIAWYDKAIAAAPDFCYAYFHKARSEQASGDTDAARRTLAAGLERAEALGDAKAAGELAAELDAVS